MNNRIMLGSVLGVCFIGMGLILYTEYSHETGPRKQPPETAVYTQKISDTRPLQPARTDLTDRSAEESPEDRTRITRPVRERPVPQVHREEKKTVPVKQAQPTPPREPAETPPPPKTRPQPEKQPPQIHAIARTEEDIRASEREQISRPSEPKETITTVVKPQETKAVSQTDAQKTNGQTDKNRTAPVQTRKAQKFVVFSRDKGATIRVQADGPFKYKTIQMHSPERVLIELEGSWDIKAPGIPRNPLVSNVRLGRQTDSTRIVIDLKNTPKTFRPVLSKDHKTLDIRVDQ